MLPILAQVYFKRLFLLSLHTSEVRISSSSEVRQLDGNLFVLRHVYSLAGTMGGSLPLLTSFAFSLFLQLPQGLQMEHFKVSETSQIALNVSP